MKRKMLTYDEIMAKYYTHLTKDDLENEIWRPAIIEGVESDRYVVSNLGRFADRNPKRKCSDAGRFQDIPGFGEVRMKNVCEASVPGKQNMDDDYLVVYLGKMFRAHVVVGSTFIRPLVGKDTFDHIVEGNAHDNRVNNLQILSISDNILKKTTTEAYESGIPVGVDWHTQRCKWRVQAPKEKNGRAVYVGLFDRLRTAASVAEIMFTENRLCDSAYVRDMLLKHYKDLEPNLDDVEHEFRASLGHAVD